MTETIGPFDTIPLTPERPPASYFSLSRRSTYAHSPAATPGSTPGTPAEEHTSMMKNHPVDAFQMRKSLFRLNMKPRRSKVPHDDKYTTPNASLDPYGNRAQALLSRARQYSTTSEMTVDSDIQDRSRGRDRFASVDSTLSDTGTLYEMNAMPKKDFMSKLGVPHQTRDRFGSVSSVMSDTPTVFEKDFVYDKLGKRLSVSSNPEETQEETQATARKASIVPQTQTIDEEESSAVHPYPPHDYARANTELEVFPRDEPTSVEQSLEDVEEEEPPYVPPAFEDIDPQIPVVEPVPAETTTSVPQFTHPWTTPPFNIIERPTPTIHKAKATVKIVLSLSVVISLLVGYGLRLKIVKFGHYSFGMYGLLLVIDFVVQTIAASVNRHRVVKITKASNMTKGVQQLKDKAAGKEVPEAEQIQLPEVSIAVVGYREDEEAWIACLKSLQAQEFPIKHIIGVVDGNDGPDLAMADAFGKAFPDDQRLIVHLPVLLSVMYKEKYWETIKILGYPAPTRWQYVKMWFTQEPRPGQEVAHETAWNHVLNYLYTRSSLEGWSKYKGICFSQPHGHKRHAMFTSFMVGAYALGTKDAMLTTDSDTYVHPDAVTNLMCLLMSSPKMAGVTGDVRIWNKKDSFLALMSSLRYWFAFNVERACQSAFGCVGCLSGPLGLYRTSDLMSVLGPWILQSFLGKETTFGDDRHLSNRILSMGHKTGYTQLAMCDSDTPAGYVRWVKQQTRWSKSFFREAFWFPKSFAYHDAWLTVEMTKQFLYPMVLTATVIQMFYVPSFWTRPVIWLSTMFGVALIKSVYGVVCMRDPMHFLFGVYGFMYFFGLLPSKLFACFTVGITTWGTSARSKSEFARPESFYSRTTHVGHLVVWYMALSVGFGYFMASSFHNPAFWALGAIGLIPTGHAYSDVITGEAKYYYFVFRKWRRARRAQALNVDPEKAAIQATSTVASEVSTQSMPTSESITDSQGLSTIELHDASVPAVRIFTADIPNPFDNPFEANYAIKTGGSAQATTVDAADPLDAAARRYSVDTDGGYGRRPSATALLDSRRPSEATLIEGRRASEVGLLERRASEATLIEERRPSYTKPSTSRRLSVAPIKELPLHQEVLKSGDVVVYESVDSGTSSSATPVITPSASTSDFSDLSTPMLKKPKSVASVPRRVPRLRKLRSRADFFKEGTGFVRVEEPEPPLPVGVAV